MLPRKRRVAVGDVVLVGPHRGVVRYAGQTTFAPGLWVGVEFKKPGTLELSNSAFRKRIVLLFSRSTQRLGARLQRLLMFRQARDLRVAQVCDAAIG